MLATSGFDAFEVSGNHVRCGAGVALRTLQSRLEDRRLFYPPAPTFDGAFVGGTVATNAAGAQTFRHGSTRRWVRRLTVVLADGDVLDLERGECRASDSGVFEIEASGGLTVVSHPTYRMPDVPKLSAGYHAEAGMDLVDLFVGSEGTLGVITDVDLGVLAMAERLVAWIACANEEQALVLNRDLHQRRDVVAIEYLDERCLELLRTSDGVETPPSGRAALLVQQLVGGTIEEALTALMDVARHVAAESVLVALPGDRRGAERFFRWRESVPVIVNHRIAEAQRNVDPAIEKVAGDMIVPFEEVEAMQCHYRRVLEARGLDHAIWGHVSDGNLHVNVLPRSKAEVAAGRAALLDLADHVIGLGGSPLSEHGVGRNPAKQEMLRRLYGDRGIEQMRAVKRALDPRGVLAPGVIFSNASSLRRENS